ncbi:SusC/RagA family TonB-linked outer membrane protein [Sphingobacterium siyangense]|uniref:SusC/RagA family TonB-linked outer membrane protein n=1 Tax=Sphingobacterium siyangense TaxID=459529 RepID=UPI002FDC8107
MKHKLLSFLLGGAILTSVAFAQEKKITGKVVSSNGENVADATVAVQGSNVATKTDSQGNYTITVPVGGKLIFRSIGYDDKVITIGNQTNYSITLTSSNANLEEVVVVGYGTGRTIGSTVGSMTRVSSEEIKGKPTANALEALSGKVPGLQVFTSSGEPSATQSIRLDGVGSLGASSTPLMVLDGIPVGAGSIVSMNPEDFESITVLKDAAATSIYGSRAANGVIYFTSKKGRIGERATITARAQYGWNDLASRKAADNFMTTDELLNFWLETGYRTQAQIDKIRQDWPNDTRWDEYYYKKNVPLKQYDLNVSGGSEKTQYYISTGYMDQTGLMYRSGFDRITLRSNITSKVNKWTTVGLNLAGGYDRRETNGWGSNSTNGGLSLLAPPFYTPIDENGNEYYDQTIPGLGRYSPRYLADKNPSKGKNQQFNPNAFIQVQPFTGLTLRSQAGMDYYNYNISTQRLPSYLGNLGKGTTAEEHQQGVSRTITNTIEYKWNLQNLHNFTVLGGQEFTDFNYESFNASGGGLTDDRLILLSATTIDKAVGQTKYAYAYNSYFGRVSYNFNNQYFFDGTVRQDESSRFGKNNKKATFWSLGGKWDAKKEAFLKDINWLNTLQVRASTGTQGNSDIGNYESLSIVGTNIYDGATGWSVSSPGNPNLSWEKQTKTTVGVSTRLFDRINLDVEYFHRVTKNMLMDVPYAYTSGFSEITSNVGGLVNNGFNVDFSIDVLRGRDFYFTPYAKFGVVNQKVTELFQNKNWWVVPNTGVSYVVGRPVEFFYPIQAGVNPDNGLMQWYVPGDDISQTNKDPNNVTSVFSATALQQSTGIKRYPPFNGGFGFVSGYKGFFLNVDFTFSNGKYLINNDRYFFANSYNFAGYNQLKEVTDYWKQPGDVTKYPKYGQVNQFDSGLLENASFLRLKGLSFGYNLPKSFLAGQKFFTGAKIYYTGRNLFTATKYLGPDPEVDSNLTYGRNPNTKQSVIGLELLF